MFKSLAAFSGFSVDSLDKAETFYSEKMGLHLDNDEMGLSFNLPGGGTVFIYEKPDHEPATFTILNFVVDDIEGAVKELKSNGIKFEDYQGMTDENNIARGKSQSQGPDIAWFKDPAGNILSVLEN